MNYKFNNFTDKQIETAINKFYACRRCFVITYFTGSTVICRHKETGERIYSSEVRLGTAIYGDKEVLISKWEFYPNNLGEWEIIGKNPDCKSIVLDTEVIERKFIDLVKLYYDEYA